MPARWLPERAPQVGFYDPGPLYSLYMSMDEVVRYLEEIDREAAERARARYACFDHYGRDPQVYAYEAGIGGAERSEQQAVEQLLELRAVAVEAALEDALDAERQFSRRRCGQGICARTGSITDPSGANRARRIGPRARRRERR